MTIALIVALVLGLLLANASLLCCLFLRLADDRRDVADARRLDSAIRSHNEPDNRGA